MLALTSRDQDQPLPMTAQFDDDKPPIWFFAAKDNSIVKSVGAGRPAVATFTSKGHDLFASLNGVLTLDRDRATIDRLWNRFVAAWFKGGKDDPQLALLRFDADRAQIWLDESSFLAGVKMLLGADPKKEYQDKVAKVQLD